MSSAMSPEESSSSSVVVLSCSLNPVSRSRVLAEACMADLAELGASAELIDLRSVDLPFCDASTASRAPDLAPLKRRIEQAHGLVIAAPVYNFDVNAAAKNMIELTSRSWAGKTVALMLAAGGRTSYMSAMGLANSLMLDFRCVIVPRIVYAPKGVFGEDTTGAVTIADPDVRRRVRQLADAVHRLGAAVSALNLEAPPA